MCGTLELYKKGCRIDYARLRELQADVRSWDVVQRYEFYRLINPQYLSREDDDKLSLDEWSEYRQTVAHPPKGTRRNLLGEIGCWGYDSRRKDDDRTRKKAKRRAVKDEEITDPAAVAADEARKEGNRERMRARRKQTAEREAEDDAARSPPRKNARRRTARTRSGSMCHRTSPTLSWRQGKRRHRHRDYDCK